MVPFDILEPASKIATVGAFIFTAITFWIVFGHTRKAEQIRLIMEFSRNLDEAENRVLALSRDDLEYQRKKRDRHIQYLNQWEQFSFLVNTGEIGNERIHEYFKPTLKRDYKTIFAEYSDLAEDGDSYKELKRLYEKWKD